MSYKTILVYVDDSDHLNDRVSFAVKIALAEQAKLIGVAVTGISKALQLPVFSSSNNHVSPEYSNPYKPEYMGTLRRHATTALDQFEMLAREQGVQAIEKRLINDDASDAVSRLGVYADLIVLGQNESNNPSMIAKVDFPEYVTLHSSCPVLMIPCAPRLRSIGTSILIAWNNSAEAMNAVRNAMPFLQKAGKVQIAVFGANSNDEPENQEPDREIVDYLKLHHIDGELIQRAATENTGNALLQLARELKSDLIVMGCVAHQRWRGVLLGGSTRVILEDATLPVLLSH